MAAIRAVATPAFLWFEYHRPGFPADAYGFSTEDRMVYGSHGLDYILNFAPARFLGDVMLPDGRHAFTAPEVGHMTDVKHVMLWSLLLVGCWLVLAVLCARRLGDGAPGALRRALFAGAWLTILLILGLLGLSLLGWERFFTGFHEIFFPEGNWAFYPSDTLIRLYPDQFWVDSAVLIALITVLAVSVLLVATWPLAHRRQRDLARAHARQEANRQAGTRRQASAAARTGPPGTTRRALSPARIAAATPAREAPAPGTDRSAPPPGGRPPGPGGKGPRCRPRAARAPRGRAAAPADPRGSQAPRADRSSGPRPRAAAAFRRRPASPVTSAALPARGRRCPAGRRSAPPPAIPPGSSVGARPP
ncbi:DUF1461 domain-containing protein [Rothia kristinae]|nr:DUF1461 domain-containing protein [Rothia kristinae]